MKGIVAETDGKYAVILTQDGLFKRVRALPGMKVGMEIEIGRRQAEYGKRKTAARIASLAAAGLLVLGAGFGAYSYNVPYSYVDIDINPSVELTVNIYDRIIGAEALNEDGERLLMDRDLRNMRLDAGVSELLNRAVEQGYLQAGDRDAEDTETKPADIGDRTGHGDESPASGGEDQPGVGDGSQASDSGSQASGSYAPDSGNVSRTDGEVKPSPDKVPAEDDGAAWQGGPAGPGKGPVIKNAVMVTVSSSNSKKSGQLKQKIASTASKKLGGDNVRSEILVGEASNEQREAARQLGVTPGKLTLIEDVLRHDPGRKLEDVKNTAVKELIEIARSNADAERADNAKPDRKDEDKSSNAKDDKGGIIGGRNSDEKNNKNKNSGGKTDGKTGDTGNGRSIAGNGEKTAPAGVPGKSVKEGGGQSAQNQKSTGNQTGQGNKNGSSLSAPDDREGGIRNGPGNIGKDRKDDKDNKKEKENGADIKQILEKSAEELKKEREKLRDELLGQIGKDRGDSGRAPEQSKSDGKKDDSRSNGIKNDKGKEHGNKKSAPGKDNKGRSGPGR